MRQRKIFQDDMPSRAEPAPEAEQLRFALLELDLVTDPHGIEHEWRRLEQFNRNSLHQGFDWCLAWIRSHENPYVMLRGTVGDRILFILPLEIVTDRGLKIARLPGGRFNNINTGLFDPALALPDTEELQNFVYGLNQALKAVADLVVLDNVPLVWRGVAHPLSGLASIENLNHTFQLPLFSNFEATLSQLNAKSRRKKFRTQSRRLEAIGGFDHVIADADGRHELLDLFFRQKGERLMAFGLPNVFHAASTQTFFHHLLDAPPNDDDAPLVLHAIRLRGDHQGKIAAIAGVSRKGDHVLCQFSSIDESLCPGASPGELLFWLMIENACHRGASIFDFGVGDQPYKRSWCTVETIQHDILIPATWKGALARPLLLALTKAKAAVKRNRTLYAWMQRRRAAKCESAAETAAASSEA
ncbi:GNAT family N-acetyltransferase [Rhizobium deserti]|uniref:GNAT family N-acetyltransferase n=1 Tax=Rhizobium deserti TaxID=2547961 RepID=A0A4R5UJH3_9HYPH|nr:GNAT family N-acetyltransferase [Rhizobium deserti]TDK37012.1 GNAT family N-acetyltransferase [Rhizobium deserti]